MVVFHGTCIHQQFEGSERSRSEFSRCTTLSLLLRVRSALSSRDDVVVYSYLPLPPTTSDQSASAISVQPASHCCRSPKLLHSFQEQGMIPC